MKLSDFTRTVAYVLQIPEISADLKTELAKHPDDWCVLLVDGGRVSVAPDQEIASDEVGWFLPNPVSAVRCL